MTSELAEKNLGTLYSILAKYDDDSGHIKSVISVYNGKVIILARDEVGKFLSKCIPVKYVKVKNISGYFTDGGYTKWEIPLELFDKELNISN